MAARKTAVKKVESVKKYLVLDAGFNQCYCTEVHTDLKVAVKDAIEHYENDGEDACYVVEIIKTVRRGKPAIHEGYFDDEENEENDPAIVFAG